MDPYQQPHPPQPYYPPTPPDPNRQLRQAGTIAIWMWILMIGGPVLLVVLCCLGCFFGGFFGGALVGTDPSPTVTALPTG